MKKLTLLILTVLMAALFVTGCGNDPLNPEVQDTTAAEDAVQKTISYEDYEDSLTGMYQYFVDSGLLDEGTPTEMSADLIGAKEGKKYSYKLNGKTITVEMYRYDSNEYNETAAAILESVGETGKFEILDLGEVEATLSPNGRYMLIYSDTAFESKKPNEDNVARKEAVLEAFNKFYADVK